MRHALIGLMMMGATFVATPVDAQVSVSIGINVPAYPTLVQIPHYPVYYAPSLHANYFFYDGLYWVFANDNWYDSPWYNGPWELVDPYDVPVFLLRVPVRYYHARPAWFRGWASDASPHWGSHWGSRWESRRAGWDHWNRSSAPAAAPLPTYQRSYSGNRYPVNTAQQAAIQTQNYSYTPREQIAQQQYQQRRTQARSAPQAAPQPTPQPRVATQQQPQTGRAQWLSEQRRQAQAQQAPQQRVIPAQAGIQEQRQQRAQQAQAQQQQQHAQQAQARGQERAQQAQARGQERAQQAQAQRQERGQPQRENRGEERGRDRHDNG